MSEHGATRIATELGSTEGEGNGWRTTKPPKVSSCGFGFATTSKCWRLDGLARNRTFVEGYLAAPFEKALARKLPDNHMFGGWGYKSIGEAREGALEGCGRQRPTERSPS
jgi:hypothetical protein